MEIRIGHWDWGLGLGIGDLDWDWGLGLGIGIGNWDLVLGLLRNVQRNMSDINRVSDWCCDLPVIGQWSHMWLDSVSHALINGPCLQRYGQWLRGYSYL